MITEFPDRTEVRYPWKSSLAISIIVGAVVALVVLQKFDDYRLAALGGLLMVAYGLAMMRRRICITPVGITYTPTIGGVQSVSFADVTAIQRRTFAEPTLGMPIPKPGLELTRKDQPWFGIPLDLPEEEQKLIFEKIDAAWKQYQQNHSQAKL